MAADSLHFAAAARLLAEAARAEGLVVPGFRSPPAIPGVDRSVRGRCGPRPTVAVRLRGRSRAAVVSDMVEGVVVANGLEGVEAARARSGLVAVLAGAGVPAASAA